MENKRFEAKLTLEYKGRLHTYDLVFTEDGNHRQEVEHAFNQITNTLGRIANGDYPYGDYYRAH